MEYWPNWEDNRYKGPIRRKQDRGAVISPKSEVDPRQYGCCMPVMDIWVSCFSTTISGSHGQVLPN